MANESSVPPDPETSSYHVPNFNLAGPLEQPTYDQSSTLPPADPPSRSSTVLGQSTDRSMPIVPGYEIIGELGHGGMGVVYQAKQLGLSRTVALKMILGGACASNEVRARFRIEAEAIAKLQHPNIVQVYEIGEYGGLPFFSLEFCGGGSLKALAGVPWPPCEAAALILTLAQAIQHAHERGIVHRDLKPANVLVTTDNSPKITDFGLAKLLGDMDGHTASGAIMGTPSYMAPEQAGGRTRTIGPAVDVYALGAILYELLTGCPPFQAATPLDTIMLVVTEEPVPIARHQPKTPWNLQVICGKCLQKMGEKRYPSAADLADDLQRFLDDRPIKARRPGIVENARRWARKRPNMKQVLKLIGAGSICALALWFAWTKYSSYRAKQLYEDLRYRSPSVILNAKTDSEKAAVLQEYRELDMKLRELGKFDPVLEERLRQKWGIHRDGDGIRIQQTLSANPK
jgi:serine/threonine protein kinase